MAESVIPFAGGVVARPGVGPSFIFEPAVGADRERVAARDERRLSAH